MNYTINFRYAQCQKEKFTCPKCTEKTFVKYIDTKTEKNILDNCGRCERENECGYNNFPAIDRRVFYSIPHLFCVDYTASSYRLTGIDGFIYCIPKKAVLEIAESICCIYGGSLPSFEETL